MDVEDRLWFEAEIKLLDTPEYQRALALEEASAPALCLDPDLASRKGAHPEHLRRTQVARNVVRRIAALKALLIKELSL